MKKEPILQMGSDRNQLVGLLTGHCHLKGHLFKLGLSDSPTCEKCQEENETATHILCECEALAYLRLCHLGQYFMEPSEGIIKRGSTIDHCRLRCKGQEGLPLIHAFIHSFLR
jgi:hypothetical protein